MRLRIAMSVAAAALLAACNPSNETADEADDTEMTEAETGTTETAERDIVAIDPANDPRMWLEEVEGEQALDWAREQNERTFARLQDDQNAAVRSLERLAERHGARFEPAPLLRDYAKAGKRFHG